jgi:RND family efflux transporter MFP subunit
MKKLFIFILLALAHAAAANAADEKTAPTVAVVRPVPTDGAAVIRLPGRTLPSQQANIYSRATGVVGERKADIGDPVKAGDVLAVIEAPEVRRSADQARAKVRQAEARARLAVATLDRARNMSRNRVIAAEALDQSEADAESTQGELQAAQAELARLEELISFQTIRAPFDGVVAERRIERGDHVQADQPRGGEALFHLVRLDELLVEVFAPPEAALRLAAGQKARLTFSELPGRDFPAEVVRSSRVLDTATGTMRIELLLPNPGRTLPAGLTGTAEIDTGSDGRVFRLPVNALLVRDGRPQVARVRDGRLEFVAVSPGRNLGNTVEVLDGVSGDDQIVISPNAMLQEGDPVAAEPATPVKP